MADFVPFSSRIRQFGLCAVGVGLIGLTITGCVRLLEPRQGGATYHVLNPPPAPDTPPTDTTGLKVGLRQPRLVSYLDATRIVTRHGPNTIRFSEFHRWGEDLDQAIGRTTALALERQPGVQSVEVVPWPKGVTFDYVVRMHVFSFEGVGPPPPGPESDDDAPAPEGHSQMVVEWRILHPTKETVLVRDRTRHRVEDWRVNDYQALASNLGTSLNVLAKDIGARLRTEP